MQGLPENLNLDISWYIFKNLQNIYSNRVILATISEISVSLFDDLLFWKLGLLCFLSAEEFIHVQSVAQIFPEAKSKQMSRFVQVKVIIESSYRPYPTRN